MNGSLSAFHEPARLQVGSQRAVVLLPSLFDPSSRIALEFQVTPSATPSTFVLDRNGRIAAARRAAVTAADLRPVVERIAAEPLLAEPIGS